MEMVAKSTIYSQAGADNTMMQTSSHQKCAAYVVVEALLEIKAIQAQMKVITKAVMKVAKNKMILQMLVVLDNAETPTFLMVKSSVIDSQTLVINTLHQTLNTGAENTMQVHSMQTQCVAHVVVEALLEIKAMTAQMKVITKAVMKVAKNKMILQMLVVLDNAETPTFLVVKFLLIDTWTPVNNTLHQTQNTGAENTMKVHSTQTQCVVHVVVEAQTERLSLQLA